MSCDHRWTCELCGQALQARGKAPLTPKQRGVLDFVVERSVLDGYAPSIEEIAKHMGWSSIATAHKILVILQEKGYLTRIKNRARALMLRP